MLYTDVVDARHTGITSDPLHDELVLVTCYPFDVLVHGGPFRLVIHTHRTLHTQSTAPHALALAAPHRGV